MARGRWMSPAFYDDPDLARCSHSARLVFPALWQLADRCGVLEWEELKVKKHAFGYDDMTLSRFREIIDELGRGGFIERAECNGKVYCRIPKMPEWQNFHKNEREQFRDVHDNATWLEWCQHGASTVPLTLSTESESETESVKTTDLLVPLNAEASMKKPRGRSAEEQARAKLVRDAFLSGYRGYYGEECDTWGAPHNAHVYHLLKSSPAEVLAAKADAYFRWQNKKAIDAGHPFMGHHASFSASLSELKADAIKPERRRQSAVVDARMKQLDTIAQDDDMLNRMRIQEQHTKDPFDDRQWRTDEQRSLGQAPPRAPGAAEKIRDASGRDAQPKALTSGNHRVVPSTGAVRGREPAVASIPDGVSGRPDAINRLVQVTDARATGTERVQGAEAPDGG